jgi:hypothetical protein
MQRNYRDVAVTRRRGELISEAQSHQSILWKTKITKNFQLGLNASAMH